MYNDSKFDPISPTAQADKSIVPTMSTSKQATSPSDSSNFTQIFDTAVDEYKKLTKEDLRTHPFATDFDVCTTPDTILDVFPMSCSIYRQCLGKALAW